MADMIQNLDVNEVMHLVKRYGPMLKIFLEARQRGHEDGDDDGLNVMSLLSSFMGR